MNRETSILPSASTRTPRRKALIGAGAVAAALLVALAATLAYFFAYPTRAPAAMDGVIEDWTGANPHPVKLLLPPDQPLSYLAQIGEKIFHDPSLSASGRQSCASCHDPRHSYGPPDNRSVQPGGPDLHSEGLRPPPSLAYLYRQDVFGIGPATAEDDNPANFTLLASKAQGTTRAAKTAGVSTAAAMVPQGGLFWDGRADTLMAQAEGPMMNPDEMANTDMADVARKIAKAPYVALFKPLAPDILNRPAMLFTEAMSALSRFQVESHAFHRFDSKYDHWLEGKARLTRQERRGLKLFNDPDGANCAGCHLSQPSRDGLPPLFTDTEYEALGVPRNRTLVVNRDPHFFDMGLCGPLRKDLAKQTQYCGMFLTPTLRNSAKRGVYFHNGVYHTLRQVLDFYNLRDTDPQRIYPHDASGKTMQFDDLPARYRANIDMADAPFGRQRGGRRALTEAQIDDIIAFLHTLDDGDTARGY